MSKSASCVAQAALCLRQPLHLSVQKQRRHVAAAVRPQQPRGTRCAVAVAAQTNGAATSSSPFIGAPQQQHVIKVRRAGCRSLPAPRVCRRYTPAAAAHGASPLRRPLPTQADGQPGAHLLRHAADARRPGRADRDPGAEHQPQGHGAPPAAAQALPVFPASSLGHHSPATHIAPCPLQVRNIGRVGLKEYTSYLTELHKTYPDYYVKPTQVRAWCVAWCVVQLVCMCGWGQAKRFVHSTARACGAAH